MSSPEDTLPQQILADDTADSGPSKRETCKSNDINQTAIPNTKITIPKNCVVTLNGQKYHLKPNSTSGSLIAVPIKETVIPLAPKPSTSKPSKPKSTSTVILADDDNNVASEEVTTSSIDLPASAERDSSAAQGLLQLSSAGEDGAKEDSEDDLPVVDMGSGDITWPKFIIPAAGGKVTVSAIRQEKISGVTKLDANDEAAIEELANQEDDHACYTETDSQAMKKELKQFLIQPSPFLRQSDTSAEGLEGTQTNLGLKTSNTDLEKLKCDQCNFQAFYQQQYDDHLRELHADSLKKCKCCAFVTLEDTKLTKHYQAIHPRNICDVCHFVNEHAYIIKRHMYRHTTEGCTCDLCGKTYKDHYILKMHIKMVHMPAEVLYECNVCSKKFTRKAHLKRHTRTHATEKAFKCPQCDYRGCERSDITKHMLIHEEPKHICEICAKPFRHQKNKDLHMKRHAGQRDYKCGVCDFFGYTFTDIRKHIERKHSEMKTILCDKCGASFKSDYDLQSHKLSWHSEQMTIIDTSDTAIEPTMETIHVQGGTTLDVGDDTVEGAVTFTNSEGEKLTVFHSEADLDTETFTTTTDHTVEDGGTSISDLTITL